MRGNISLATHLNDNTAPNSKGGLGDNIKGMASYLTARTTRTLTRTKSIFQQDFGLDGTSLDIHDYDTNLRSVPLKLIVERCKDSALPFYYPWVLMDEADVVLVEVKSGEEVAERLRVGCPDPHTTADVACLIFVRAGQLHNHEEKAFVYSSLLMEMERRNQRFVLVTAWQEVYCTPYTVQHHYKLNQPKNWIVVARQHANAILESPLLVAWFGKNLCINHPKLYPVPLGAKRVPNSIHVTERMFKTDLWMYLDGHRPRHSFLKKEKDRLLASPMFEISTTGSPAFTAHKFYREKLMKVRERWKKWEIGFS